MHSPARRRERRPCRGTRGDRDVGGHEEDEGGQRYEERTTRAPREHSRTQRERPRSAAGQDDEGESGASAVDSARAQRGLIDAAGASDQQRLRLAHAVCGKDRQRRVRERRGENSVRGAHEQRGGQRPGKGHEEAHARRRGEHARGNPRHHRGNRRRRDQQEGGERSRGDTHGHERRAENGHEDRQRVGPASVSVAARDPRGPRGTPQLGPRGGQGHPGTAHEAGRRTPPLHERQGGSQDEEPQGSRCRAEAVAPHRGDDERIDPFSMLVFVHACGFLAQQGGSRLKRAEGRAGNSARLSCACASRQQARGRADQGHEGTDFGESQRGPARQDASQGAGGAPHEEPQR